jgi:hypothetical protein
VRGHVTEEQQTRSVAGDRDLILDAVRRSLHSPEADDRAGCRQRRILLWGGSTAILPILLCTLVGDSFDAKTWGVWALFLGVYAWLWRRAGHPWIVRDEVQVKHIAEVSNWCPRCGAVVLPRDGEQCIRCEALVHPGKMVAVVAVSCLLLVAYVLLRLR